MRLAVLLALLPATSIAAIAPKLPAREQTCEILEYGLYVGGGDRTRFDDPESVTGERFEITDVRFTKQTKAIPLALNTGFGIHYALHGLPKNRDVTIAWRISYPRKMKNSTGWNHVFDERTTSGDMEHTVLYDFIYDYELVPGPWKFDVRVDGSLTCSFTFQVK